MQISAFLLPFTVAAAAAAAEARLPTHLTQALQYRRNLAARQDLDDPKLYCGENYSDCGDGWCCRQGTDCAGKLYDIPVCKNPTVTATYLQTEPAIPYENTDEALSSLESALSKMTQGVVGFPTTLVSGGDATDTVSPQQTTGGAAVDAVAPFGRVVGVVGAIWGLAALGGAGWVLL
ncbi:hypothetical protein K458DRAFT_482671 [Lentithecium fluviatile CBS 122367]|uniref:Uncharacterized protein n=1 Tax=Lentithecium fluviatile CBS 122367 TaxID=1168545 RepID=A0A6G1JNA9_9PLEO|nr:hypothetical protein K458DRAFT_482671 [Lentithecium fluviatile CBS 122367]